MSEISSTLKDLKHAEVVVPNAFPFNSCKTRWIMVADG